MYYVYILFSYKDAKLYTGYSSNLQRRIREHHAGKSTATRDRRPLKLIYYEAHLTSDEALRREKFLKGGNGRGQLKLQIESTLTNLGYACL